MEEEFERYAKDKLSDTESARTLLQKRDDKYSWSHVQDAWVIWQAAWKQAKLD